MKLKKTVKYSFEEQNGRAVFRGKETHSYYFNKKGRWTRDRSFEPRSGDRLKARLVLAVTDTQVTFSDEDGNERTIGRQSWRDWCRENSLK